MPYIIMDVKGRVCRTCRREAELRGNWILPFRHPRASLLHDHPMQDVEYMVVL